MMQARDSGEGSCLSPCGNIGNILKMLLSSGFSWGQTLLGHIPVDVKGGSIQTWVAATCGWLFPLCIERSVQGFSCDKKDIVLISSLHSIGLG